MSVPTTIATSAVVGLTAGTAGYFKGYLDGVEYNKKYLEAESSWRLVWDKQMVFMRQLIVGKLRNSSVAYTDTYLARLITNIGEMKTLLVVVFPEVEAERFSSNLALYVNTFSEIVGVTSATQDPPTRDQAIQLRTLDNAMAAALEAIDDKLFNVEEARALLYELTVNMLRMSELERTSDTKNSLIAYTELQALSANLAKYFAKAINFTTYPIRKWL
jgi:hypothetical protein